MCVKIQITYNRTGVGVVGGEGELQPRKVMSYASDHLSLCLCLSLCLSLALSLMHMSCYSEVKQQIIKDSFTHLCTHI